MVKIYLSTGREDAPKGFTKVADLSECTEPIDELIANNALETTPSLTRFLIDVHNRLIDGGKATFASFYFRHPLAWSYPSIVRGISEHSLSWTSKAWREANKNFPIELDMDFEAQFAFATDPDLENRSADAKNFAVTHWSGSVSAIHFVLIKKS